MKVIFHDGQEHETDMFASIPNPPRIYFRLPELTMVEAMVVASNREAMKRIQYLDYVFHNCAVIAVSDENGTPKISASYETMEITGG